VRLQEPSLAMLCPTEVIGRSPQFPPALAAMIVFWTTVADGVPNSKMFPPPVTAEFPTIVTFVSPSVSVVAIPPPTVPE
jgi:hypothetical protein